MSFPANFLGNVRNVPNVIKISKIQENFHVRNCNAVRLILCKFEKFDIVLQCFAWC